MGGGGAQCPIKSSGGQSREVFDGFDAVLRAASIGGGLIASLSLNVRSLHFDLRAGEGLAEQSSMTVGESSCLPGGFP